MVHGKVECGGFPSLCLCVRVSFSKTAEASSSSPSPDEISTPDKNEAEMRLKAARVRKESRPDRSVGTYCKVVNAEQRISWKESPSSQSY